MINILKITDDVLVLDCSCGEELECPSFYKQARCGNCGETVNLTQARDDFYARKFPGVSYMDDLKLKAHKIKNKFYDKYGNVKELVKKLKLDK